MESSSNKIMFNFSSLRKTFRKESNSKSAYSVSSGTREKCEDSEDRLSSDDDLISINHRNRPQKIYRSIKKKFKNTLCKSKQKVTAVDTKCGQPAFIAPETKRCLNELGSPSSPVYYPPVPPRQKVIPLRTDSTGRNSRALQSSRHCNNFIDICQDSSLIVCTSSNIIDYQNSDDFVSTPSTLGNMYTSPLRCIVGITSRQISFIGSKNRTLQDDDLLPSISPSYPMNIVCVQNRNGLHSGELFASDIAASNSPPSTNLEYPSSNNTFGSDYSSLKRHGYYWGPISRQEAEEKLSNQPDGTFLIRDSSSDNHLFSLTFRSWGKTLHSRIEYAGGTYSICDQDGYKTIVELIEQAMNSSNNSVYCYSRSRTPTDPVYPVRLTSPLSRLTKLRSLKHKCRYVIREYVNINDIEKLPLPVVIKDYLKEEGYF